MPFFGFHPIIARWFRSRFEQPTEPQRLGWPHITAGEHTLIAAPTGSGKTLAAFLACIDRLLKESFAAPLPDEFRVVYVSPLRALSNDMHQNLEVPIAEITELAEAQGEPIPLIRAGLRIGDTSAYKRAAMVRRPPHILVTTPESLYLMLTAPKSREKLRHVETVIIDEIHALIRDKRGSHLALTLQRLETLGEQPLQRIGLSATQKPIERVAEFLIGVREGEARESQTREGKAPAEPSQAVCFANHPVWLSEISTANSETDAVTSPRLSGIFALPNIPANPQSPVSCQIVDVGHARELDLGIEVPASQLGAVCMHE